MTNPSPVTDAPLARAHDAIHALHQTSDTTERAALSVTALQAYLELDTMLRRGEPLPTKWQTAQLLRGVAPAVPSPDGS